MKRRRGFTRYAAGDFLLVFSLRALDGQGCPIAKRPGVARAPSEGAANDVERQLQGDVTRHQRAAAVAARRRCAVAGVLDESRPIIQPALFDRRALDSRDATAGAIANAQRQLDVEANQPASLQFDFVAGFEVK